MKFGFRYFAWEFTSDGWVKNIIAKSSVFKSERSQAHVKLVKINPLFNLYFRLQITNFIFF